MRGMISQAQSRLAIVQAGLGAVLGNIVGGAITSAIGIEMSFIVMSIVIIGATAAIFFAYNAYKARQPANV